MAQGQAEEAFDAQAELDGGVAEHVLPAPLAAGGCVPLHVFVQPDRQRAPGFERCVVRCPVGGLVAGLGALGFTHVPRLTVRGAGFVQQSPRDVNNKIVESKFSPNMPGTKGDGYRVWRSTIEDYAKDEIYFLEKNNFLYSFRISTS